MTDPAADLLPEGLEDRLPQSTAAAARIERAVLAVLDAHGYDRVRPPLIEFMQSIARRMDGVKTAQAVPLRRSRRACARSRCART